MIRTSNLVPAALLGILVLLAGCGAESPPTGPEADPDDTGTEPPPPPPPPTANAAAGKVAYEKECAGCHTSRDAFDMAFFGFADADIIRRGVAHVDSATARNIVEYVNSLPVTRTSPAFRPFQPGSSVASGDAAFWNAAFGTSGWPGGLTPAQLKAMDPADVSVPLPLPLWSSEADDSDWMPDAPLPDEVLDASSGALRDALESYYASPTNSALATVLAEFQRVTTGGGRVCAGAAGSHTRPADCFDVRRWMSALAAQHYLRYGTSPDVPLEVAEIWWDTGEAAVSVRLKAGRTNDVVAQTNAAAWLYLGFSKAPGAFGADEGYMGEHLELLGLSRLTTFAALRRMVEEGPADQEDGSRRYWDALIAAHAAPGPIKNHVAEFAFDYLLAGLNSGTRPTQAEKDRALYAVGEVHFLGTRDLPPNDPARTTLTRLRDQIVQGIG